MTFAAGCLLLLALVAAPPAPAPAVPKSEILGLWKGSSVCTKAEGTELCRDETVVYNFMDIPDQPATVSLKAARIVDGTLQETFSLYVTYRPETRAWTAEFERPHARGVWTYAIKDGELTGNVTLLPEAKVIRNLSAKRVSRDQVLK